MLLVVVIRIPDMSRNLPPCTPVITTASITWLCSEMIRYLVPLQCPFEASKFQRSMMLQCFFKITCGVESKRVQAIEKFGGISVVITVY